MHCVKTLWVHIVFFFFFTSSSRLCVCLHSQNKGKRGDGKEPGADGLKEDVSSPDTGQQQSLNIGLDGPESTVRSPAEGASGPSNNSSNYNLACR